jgi:hypothetical protein
MVRLEGKYDGMAVILLVKHTQHNTDMNTHTNYGVYVHIAYYIYIFA